jgi:hypothetical protein
LQTTQALPPAAAVSQNVPKLQPSRGLQAAHARLPPFASGSQIGAFGSVHWVLSMQATQAPTPAETLVSQYGVSPPQSELAAQVTQDCRSGWHTG